MITGINDIRVISGSLICVSLEEWRNYPAPIFLKSEEYKEIIVGLSLDGLSLVSASE